MVPPVPIPNTVVKHINAEGTWLETAWEIRELPVRGHVFAKQMDGKEKRRLRKQSSFFVAAKPGILSFMDVQMPVMNGYDATRAIRAHESHYCKTVPIVAMTANAFAEDVHAAKTVGMNEHIAKPLDLRVLQKTMRKWLGRLIL